VISVAKPLIGKEEKEAVMKVLDSGMIAHGPVTEAFEKEFATYTGAKHAFAVANGTVALHAALLAVGVKPGDEVVTTPFTFIASVNSILLAGGRPVFADVDPATFNIDPEAVRKAVTPRTKAILPVHLYGLSCDMKPLLEVAQSKGIPLVEDAAQSHGATYKGKQVGTMGDAGCFSMYPTKNMTTGEGGMVTTQRDDVAEFVKSFRNHGRGLATLGTYDHVRLGHNFRLTDLGSAIGREQLKKLPGFNEARRRNAKALDEALASHAHLEAPAVPAGRGHVYHQYTVKGPDRSGLQAYLKAKDIGSGVYYPKVCYDYPHIASYKAACPKAERLAQQALSVPVHAGLQPAEVQQVAEALRSWRP
jgi:perosamine synthetase